MWKAVSHDGQPAILKTIASEWPDPSDIAELEREYALMRRLQVPGVLELEGLIAHGDGNVAIHSRPFGRSLAQLLDHRDRAPLPLERFFPIAIGVAQILGALHEVDVVHKDIAPRNLLIDDDGQLRLIDFGIASELSRERQSQAIGRRLEGSLPYISPEQTGRMNRDLDYRSDYYSLGVTLFELLTGRLPFQASGVLEWVHRHIGHRPPGPSQVEPSVPEQLGRVVLKLLAKSAEDRYQSTFGLIRDLERCRDEHARSGTIQPFPLGQHDLSRRFQIPQQLFGREAELLRLRDLFDEVAGGAQATAVVSGWSGVGKSALVNELSKSIAGEQGYLLQGKFDQFQQNTPYFAVATAFRGLARQLLAEPAERLDTWRSALTEALGPNAALVVDLVPELELIVGPQPAPPPLGPTEAQNRFQLAFLDFVRVFTSSCPLVVFLDDLQWSDQPTLKLIERLLGAQGLGRLLLIGAYRSNEVGADHPLQLTLDALRQRDALELQLQPLDRGAVARLIAATVRAEPGRVEPLASAVYARTRGNPFFVNELLKRLYEAGAIRFLPDQGAWSWDLQAVERADVGDSVVAFMVTSLRRLPEPTQQALQLAACIGSAFDLRTLAVIHERDPAEVSEALLPALKRNLIVPLSDDYRYAGHGPRGAEAPRNAWYTFQHDRVQQAAHALIAPERRAGVHLSIGRLVLASADARALDERLLEITNHLNEGRGLITDAAERGRLVQLNLDAAAKARAASAHDTALQHARVAHELAPGEDWVDDPALTRAIFTELQLSAYLSGDLAEADARGDALLANARDDLERANLLATRTRQYATVGRMKDSIEAAIAGLRLLGVDFTATPEPADIEAQRARVTANLAGRRVEQLIDAPPITGERELLAIRVLMEIFPAAFLSGSGQLFPYLVLELVNLSIEHGSSPESAFAYGAYGMLLCGAFDDPALGLAYGELSVAMNERFEDLALRSRVLYVYAMFIHHWSHPWASMTPWFQQGIEAGHRSGDLLYLAYSAQDCIIWDPTLDLESASRQQRAYLSIVRETGYRDSFDSGSLFLQMQRNFLGRTDGLFSMDTDDFDEQATVDGMRARGFMTGVANHQIYKAEIHSLYDDHTGALRWVELQEPMIASSMALPQIVRFTMVAFLTRAALLPSRPPDQQPAYRARLDAQLAQMERWAANCEANFRHLADHMRGELAALDGDLGGAMRAMQEAMQGARDHGFRRDEARAAERLAQLLLAEGFDRAAEGYLRTAHYVYYRWGAHRKVARLEEAFPQLVGPAGGATIPVFHTFTTSNSVDTSSLDMASVLKASQAISGELELTRLWTTTLQVLLENAGAQRGSFVLAAEGGLEVQARADFDGEATTLDLPEPVDEAAPTVPVSLLRAVLRTREPLVLADASSDERFGADPYVQARGTRSVLCIPTARQGRFEGAIYLENDLTPGAFTEERIEVIRLLSAQAAISSENAHLYQAQKQLIRAQRRFVPEQFLHNLGHEDIARVEVGQSVAREMSVLFADLRGFTPLTERLGPRNIIALLNRYFDSLEGPIAAAGGFIDSFNGDEIMALFGVAPDRAVDAGVHMWRALEEFNRRSVEEGGPRLKMGVGVNTGALVLGTVGSQNRLKCGVVGDTVNLASRIEQLTKHYDAPLLIGEQTRDALVDPERFSLRCVDRVAVKGKSEGVALYEVLDAESPARRVAKEATRDLLDEARARYVGRDFDGALEPLRRAIAHDPDDPVLSILAARCARYRDTPPPDEWDGVEALQHK